MHFLLFFSQADIFWKRADQWVNFFFLPPLCNTTSSFASRKLVGLLYSYLNAALVLDSSSVWGWCLDVPDLSSWSSFVLNYNSTSRPLIVLNKYSICLWSWWVLEFGRNFSRLLCLFHYFILDGQVSDSAVVAFHPMAGLKNRDHYWSVCKTPILILSSRIYRHRCNCRGILLIFFISRLYALLGWAVSFSWGDYSNLGGIHSSIVLLSERSILGRLPDWRCPWKLIDFTDTLVDIHQIPFFVEFLVHGGDWRLWMGRAVLS